MGNIKTEQLKINLQISDNFDIALVIALGKPIEKVVIEPIDKSDGSVNIKYWTDENKIHHVPKYSL